MARGGEGYIPDAEKEEVVHKTLKYNLQSDRDAINHWLQCHSGDIKVTLDDKGRIDTITVYDIARRKIIHKVEYQN